MTMPTPSPSLPMRLVFLDARSASDDVGAAYQQNRQDALAADLFGSPVCVLDREVFWEQDRIELLADALKSGRKAYSSNV